MAKIFRHTLPAIFSTILLVVFTTTLLGTTARLFNPETIAGIGVLQTPDIKRQQSQDTIPEPLPLPADTVIPDTTIALPLPTLPPTLAPDTSAEPVDIALPDTTPVPATQPAPTPVARTLPPEVSQPQEPGRIPFRLEEMFTVQWDSTIYNTQIRNISRVYSASAYYGQHELKSSRNFRPIPTSGDRHKTNDLFAILIIINLSLLAIARYFFPVRLKETIYAIWESRYYNQLEREGDFFRSWVSFFLFLNFLLTAILLIFQSLELIGLTDILTGIPLLIALGSVIAALLSFFLAKIIIMYFIAWVFKTTRATNSYLLNIMIINMFAGVIILPVLVINMYSPLPGLLYLAWALLMVINLYKIIRGIFIGLNTAGFSAYYLILYLCAIELTPLLLLIKYSLSHITT